MKIRLFLAAVLLACGLSAETIEAIVVSNQKTALPEYPEAVSVNFSGLQKKAVAGDADACQKVPQISIAHIRSVYKVLSAHKGLLFSVRKPVRGYDTVQNNYAVNIEKFFTATTDEVRVRKNGFDISTSNGSSYAVSSLNYSPADSSIEVKAASGTCRIPLSQLTAADRRFVENALQDEIFESSGSFVILSKDTAGPTRVLDTGSLIHPVTGKKIINPFLSGSEKQLIRRIILENKGCLPLENLVIEHQSFSEQTLMKWTENFPTDYCCGGFVEVKLLAPGEKKEIEINLPATVEARQESVSHGNFEDNRPIPVGFNKWSEGRMNGIRVRVHRFTPYGERLTREYKSAGVPSLEWSCVAPTTAELKR